DDGSRDQTRALAQARGARVVTQANLGAAAARNLGAQNARGEIVIFLDADCIPEKNWLAAMGAPFANSQIVGAGGMKRTHQRGIVPMFIQMEFDYRYDRVRAHAEIDFVDSGTAAYRREIFLRAGGFDPRLSDAEDVDLSYRLSEQGFKMAFARDAIVYHLHPESVWNYWRRKFIYAAWRTRVYARHPRKIARDSRTPPSQRAQGALAALLLACVFFFPFFPFAFFLCAFAFLLTIVPFLTRYLVRDWRAALLAPIFILGAAYAGDAGVLWGFLNSNFTTKNTKKNFRSKI
ncbi:MAG: glycosyltransferase, partial [Chloroflexi bacterium]|nr:glycosyltransferase [Chloroflexota bacterium]